MCNIELDIRDLEKKIDEVVECFYQQREREGYRNLDLLFPQLIGIVDQVALLEKEQRITMEESNLIATYLSYALQALEEKDVVLLSDIMQYDLMRALIDITTNLQ